MANDTPERRARIRALVELIEEAADADFQAHAHERGNLNVALTALASALCNIVERVNPTEMRESARQWCIDALGHPERRMDPDEYVARRH